MTLVLLDRMGRPDIVKDIGLIHIDGFLGLEYHIVMLENKYAVAYEKTMIWGELQFVESGNQAVDIYHRIIWDRSKVDETDKKKFMDWLVMEEL